MKRLFGLGAALAALGAWSISPPGAPTSCDEWLPPPREVKAKKVGPTSCLMRETDLAIDARGYTRLDIGLNGTVDGYLARQGEYHEYLTNSPDLVFPQSGNPGPILFAVAAYERDKGAAMTLVYPADRRAWNGKLFVTAHGRGASFKQGSLKAWDRNLDAADPARDLDKYDRLMIAKGYALAKTHRTSVEGIGEIVATLEDGSQVDFAAFNDTARYITDFTEVAKRALQQRLGQPPRLSYLYGHSAGARIGRGMNYTPGLNRDHGGRPFFNGFLDDDAAAGTWLPMVMKDGTDVLFAADADKAAFVPQLDISHQMYNNIWDHRMPPYMSLSYLDNKRRNARILRDKGLAPAKERMYEIRGISHSGGENLPEGRRGNIEILDLSWMMDRIIDILDAWVDKGVDPPPTHSDWVELGAPPALAFPEIACPLGVYYPTEPTSGTTSFAAFTGQGLEPLDNKKVFVDMNRNGVWDYRETPSQAWQRLGLLRPGDA